MLAEDIRPWIKNWRDTGKTDQYRCDCPARQHGSGGSLSFGIGDRGGLIWQCFAGCTRGEVRAALIRAGVSPAALGPVPAEDVLATVRRILSQEPPGPLRDLRLAAVVFNGARMPTGGPELTGLAAMTGISQATAYRAVTAIRKVRIEATDTLSLRNQRARSTCGFGAKGVTAARTGIRGESQEQVIIPARRCEECEHEIGGRSDARFCSRACKERARRKRGGRPS